MPCLFHAAIIQARKQPFLALFLGSDSNGQFYMLWSIKWQYSCKRMHLGIFLKKTLKTQDCFSSPKVNCFFIWKNVSLSFSSPAYRILNKSCNRMRWNCNIPWNQFWVNRFITLLPIRFCCFLYQPTHNNGLITQRKTCAISFNNKAPWTQTKQTKPHLRCQE